MGLLDNFERGLEKVVGGAFARTFRSGVQPIEIAAALRRELDTTAAVVSRDRILVPNLFTVSLSTTDHERLDALGDTLLDELTGLVQTHATTQGYQFAGGIGIALDEDPTLPQGVLRVTSRGAAGTVSWTPYLEIDGRRQKLGAGRTVLGRGTEADITIDDPGISRKHIEILWDGERAQVTDLGSTNGSRLNGEPLRKALLEPDSVITIGRTRIVFRVLAQSTPDPAPTTRLGRSSEGGR